ncbi:MAG: polysaccharide deacetylase family protein [Bacteroidota bacterium]|nr:MAG: polysaccharide deacetylase [Bacteroidota bacterium]
MVDPYGAIVRGDTTEKSIFLVFTGDEFADGGAVIRSVLRQRNVKAGFFFTGNFYANDEFEPLIKDLLQDGHYLGAHSDKHLLYCDWSKRDSLLVTRRQFRRDLKRNYKRMAEFGIDKNEAKVFLPPYEWYNASVVKWTHELGLTLVNFTPGTLSTADYTYPDMGTRYRNSDTIFRSIMDYESNARIGMNGFILLVHIGTDPRRTDKFYDRLDQLLVTLMEKGYSFKRIDELVPEGTE